ncbi:MAG: hypothetical protein ACK5OX_13990 [Desertimonas sp.]
MSTGFGSSGGPPATDRQIGYLESLLRKAGHADWGDARRAYGLTAKQGRGKFTKIEASALIDRLTATDDDDHDDHDDDDRDGGRARRDAATASAATDPGPLAGFPADVLAAELRRRGWGVIAPQRDRR